MGSSSGCAWRRAQVTPEVLYCAKRAGVTHVLKAGGAQAVAAMAWGTQTCPKVGSALARACLARQSACCIRLRCPSPDQQAMMAGRDESFIIARKREALADLVSGHNSQ